MTDQVALFLMQFGFVAVLILMFLNGSISAPPSEIILGLSGVASAHGAFSFALGLVAATIGNLLGTTLLYWIARSFLRSRCAACRERMKGWPFPFSLMSHILPSEELVSRYELPDRSSSLWWLCYCRCLPVVRSAISVPAGILKVSLSSFILYTTLGVFLWALGWMAFGYFAGALAIDHGKGVFLAAAFVGFLVVYVLRHLYRKQQPAQA